jgi:hypothetical protein
VGTLEQQQQRALNATEQHKTRKLSIVHEDRWPCPEDYFAMANI